MTEKRRRKTGCLTCRTRKVKCDERKPECERCEAANVVCAGYAEKRRLKTTYPGQTPATTTETPHTEISLPTTPSPAHQYAQPRVRDDGLPLVALPVNPNPFQRPHSRARDMLGYHQYIYRTLTILFAPKSLFFWRDYLCEAAWETEWVFDTIVALGSMHRATLLLSKEDGSDHDRGLDTKIAAIQTYIRALDGVSRNLNQIKSATPLTVGVLILMAYIECFSGNTPAAIRHTQVSQYYSRTMLEKHQTSQLILPIESSLRDLELICRIARPFPSPLEPSSLSNAEKLTVNLPSSFFELVTSSSSVMLQKLLEFTSADLDLKHIVWCVYAAHYKTVSKEKVLAFLQALDDWKTYNLTTSPILIAEGLQFESSGFSYQGLNKVPFPPLPYKQMTWEYCLALALYNFYKARLLWALCLLGDEDRQIESYAYFHVYELLRYTRTVLNTSQDSSSDSMISCENIRIGFSPLLYLAGRCCPSPLWLRWVILELGNIKKEGLFDNKPFATCLNVLISLEELKMNASDSSSDGENFVRPCMRTIAVFIPDIDGRGFEAYFARLRDQSMESETRFCLSKVARWSDEANDPVTSLQDYERSPWPFSPGWLLQQPIVKKWLDWSCIKEFDLNQVVEDHINGNRLLLEMASREEQSAKYF